MLMKKMSEQQTTLEAGSQPLMEPYLPEEEEEERRPCVFYKLIVPSILRDKKLRIPYKCVKRFGDELCTIAKLSVPNGRIWLVELRKLNKQLWFDIGWHEFVEDCSIRAGYFMIFKYQGNSKFNVYIFDLSTSEIEYPHNTLSSLEGPSGGKQSPVPVEKNRGKDNSFVILQQSSSPCPVPTEKGKEKDDSFAISPPLSGPCPVPTEKDKGKEDTFTKSTPLSSQCLVPTEKHTEKEKSSLSSLLLSFPCLVPTEKGREKDNSFLTSSLLSSECPTEKHKEKNESFLGSPSLSSPSPVLFSSNIKDVDEGGCCKTNKNSTYGFKLEYLHLPKKIHNQEATVQPPKDEGIQVESKLTSTKNEARTIVDRGKKRKILGLGQITDSHEPIKEAAVPKGRISFKKYTRRGRALTFEEKKSALRAAVMFQTDNPFFKVVLQPSAVYKTLVLHIPSTFARAYLRGIPGDVTLRCPNGKQQRVRCIWQNGKAKFSQGWSEFVRENSLDESDVCVFELIKTDDLVLKVTIFRVSKMQDQSTNLQSESSGTTKTL